MKNCPNCKEKSYVVSVFGSICSNCLYSDSERSDLDKIKKVIHI